MGQSMPQQVPPPPAAPPPLAPPPAAGPRPLAPQQRAQARGRLVRSRDDRMVAGVCAGAARSMGIDPTWVRLAVVALTLFAGGVGVPLYLIAWIVMPVERDGLAYVPADTGDDGGWSASGAEQAWVPVATRRRGGGGALLGALLIAAGIGLLLARLGLPALTLPVVFIILGAAVVIAGARR